MQNPLISIVIPTYNRAELLRGALQSLVCQKTEGKFAFEIIVVDNASTDATIAVFEETVNNSPDVIIRYIYEKTPTHPDALNRGVKESSGEWIAFFDDDELAEPEWLLELFNAALETGARIIGGPVHLDLRQEELAKLSSICRIVLREIRPYSDLHRYVGIELPGSGNALIAREVFNAVGMFDNSMVTGSCDRDFVTRARLAGFDMWYTPKAVVRHHISKKRLLPEFFRWEQLKGGTQSAYYDFKYRGTGKMLFYCIARISKSLIINLPLIFIGWIRRDHRTVLGRKCLLWRAEGYTRKTLSLIAPGLFPQDRFFTTIEIRRGRTDGINS